jgi:chromosome partitioning protein
MQRIVVLNPKGGSGKTTIAINLASHFALQGERTVLIDHDPQASAARWVKKRQDTQAAIHLIAAFERDTRVTRSFQMRIPDGAERVIVDTPAALQPQEMPELTRAADRILVPVLPSDIDIQAASRCIQNLLLVAKVKREQHRLGIIANRVRRNTVIYQSLARFLHSLDIPIVATLRDSQAYVRAVGLGLGLAEMKPYQVSDDLAEWRPLLEWLDAPRHGSTDSASHRRQDGIGGGSANPGAEHAGVGVNPTAALNPAAAAAGGALGEDRLGETAGGEAAGDVESEADREADGADRGHELAAFAPAVRLA